MVADWDDVSLQHQIVEFKQLVINSVFSGLFCLTLCAFFFYLLTSTWESAAVTRASVSCAIFTSQHSLGRGLEMAVCRLPAGEITACWAETNEQYRAKEEVCGPTFSYSAGFLKRKKACKENDSWQTCKVKSWWRPVALEPHKAHFSSPMAPCVSMW